MLRVTPLYGSRWCKEGQAEEPECTLIDFSGCRVLWNVGWWTTASSSAEDAESFPELPEHDCLILTASTLQAAGGLPLYYRAIRKKGGNPPPIYATLPTLTMGQLTLYDQHASICLDGGLPHYTLEDVDNIFASMQSIKYSQSINIQHPETGQAALSVTAHRAGHVVGGSFFVLKRLQDETEVVLTSTYHIARELHLDSSTLLKHASTPEVLVTHPGGPAFRRLRDLTHGPQAPLQPQLLTQTERSLTEAILSVLRRDGHVLLPVDAAGRVLELVLMLNQHWERHRWTGAYNLCWMGPMVRNTAESARSQLEWMGARLGQQFDLFQGHPYQLKAVRLCATMRELETFMEENQNPTCVLASGLSLEGGPARDVFLKFADNPDNAVVFTDTSQCYLRRAASHAAELDVASIDPIAATGAAVAAAAAADTVNAEDDGRGMLGSVVDVSSPWTTAAQLLLAWAEAKREQREMDDSIEVDVHVPQRSPLSGLALKAFLEQEEAARQKQKAEEEKRALLREVELAKGQLRLGEDEPQLSSASESKSGLDSVSKARSARPRKRSRFDSSLFLRFSKPLHMKFEDRDEAAGIGQSDNVARYGIGEAVGRSGAIEDDYGIAVNASRFVDIVSGVDPSKLAGGSGRIGDEVRRRGLGYAVDSTRQSALSGAKVSEDEDNADEEELDDEFLEAKDLSEGNGIVRGRNGRPPTKVSAVRRKLEVFAEISFVPLEGRVDARAARQSARALQPRQVVVLGGPSKVKTALVDEVAALAEACESFAGAISRVSTPSDGETVELAVGHAAYSVRLIDTPYRTKEEKDALDMVPKPIEHVEVKLGACTVSLVDCIATGQKVAADGSIVLAPRVSSTSHPAVYLSDGEVLLTDLRAELIAQGLKADYSVSAGFSQLVVNGKIMVKKAQDSGRINIEGPLCEDYFSVRGIVCGQYVVL